MFLFEIVDFLPIVDRHIVFCGRVAQGEVRIGDELFLKSPRAELIVRVASLEPGGLRRSGARAGDNVAIVVPYLDLGPVSDGFRLGPDKTCQTHALVLQGSSLA